ncbi:MAG: hypothetical protein JW874_16525 [Spirochaetales bacterium]|nr:hypothetical protein [Spirochaetales bacterium]
MGDYDLNKGEADTSSKSPEKKTGLFERIVSFLFKNNDPDRERKRLLKEISISLKKSKYKFYKIKSEEALPGMAKFFYEIYKTIGPAQVFIDQGEAMGVLKTLIIEKNLPDRVLEIKEQLSERSIREKTDTMEIKTVASILKEHLITFISSFNADRVKEINASYQLLSVFLQFINYDYYFMLKKFDSGLHERDFIYNPKFEAINGEYVSEDLKEFISIIYLLDPKNDWQQLFEALKVYKGNDIVNINSWNKIVKGVDAVKKSRILEQMVRHIDKDPYCKFKFYPPTDNIVEEYLSKIKTQTEITVQKIIKEKKNRKIDQLLKAVFGTTAISRMRNYNDKANLTFSKKMLAGYLYVQPANYLKAFFLDYYKKDIKELVDMVLIRGRWSTNVLSQQLSDSFHRLLDISAALVKFDESLGEEGDKGHTIRNAVKRADRDKNAAAVLRKIVRDINEKALNIINDAAQNLIVVGKNIKMLIDDLEKKPHEVLVNWKELQTSTDNKIREHMTVVYKKIYYFIQLMQNYIKDTKSGEEPVNNAANPEEE